MELSVKRVESSSSHEQRLSSHQVSTSDIYLRLRQGTRLIYPRFLIFVVTELINRLDSIQVFNKLSHQSILSIVSLRLADVAARLKDRRITLDLDAESREWLARHGYSNEYGRSHVT